MKKNKMAFWLFFILLFNYGKSNTCADTINRWVKIYCGHNFNTTHSCIYHENKCIFNYNDCSSYKGQDETICGSIILSDNWHKCVIKDNVCTDVKRSSCEEYVEGIKKCSSFYDSSNGKRCVLINDKCQTHYNYCNDFKTDVNEEKCLANIPKDVNKKCIWENNECKEVKRSCKEFEINSGNAQCSILDTSDKNKICMSSSDNGIEHCEEKYKTCELYDEKETVKTKEGCESIHIYSDSENSFDESKVCKFTGTKCFTKDKECEDISYKGSCKRFEPKDSNKMCIYIGDQCKTQFKTCELYDSNETSKTKEGCENIKIYSEAEHTFVDNKICKFEGSTCSTKDKECEDISSEEECKNFTPEDTDKICTFNDNKCITQYKTCELYDSKETSKTKSACESIKIYLDSTRNFDDLHLCTFSGEKCSTREKQCEDYFPNCKDFTLSDQNKECINNGNKCVLQYKTCKLYNDNEPNKNKDDCEAIKLSRYGVIISSSFCVYKDGECFEQKKPCEEIYDLNDCQEHELDEDRMCIFTLNYEFDMTGVCSTVLKNCAAYNKLPNKTEKGCKDFRYYYPDAGINHYYKCYYEGGECKEKKVTKCEDAEGDKDFCEHIYEPSKKCVFKNNKCVGEYNDCPGEEISKEICESIKPYSEYGYCGLDENNKCVLMIKKCSEYKGDNLEFYCIYNLEPTDENKKCFYENGKCFEKYIYCSGYQGNDASICESIIPYENKYKSLESTHKCIMKKENNNFYCTMVEKECKDAKNENECTKKILAPTNKQCIYDNGQCKEQYIDCDTYTNNVLEVDKNICESIKLPYILESKCVYNPDTKKCEQTYKECSEFNKDDYKEYCLLFPLILSNKICDYVNSDCIEAENICTKLNSMSGITEEICSKASIPNSKKKCQLKEDGSGCEEKDINEQDDNNDSGDDDNNNTNNDNGNTSNGGKNKGRYISEFKMNLLIIILWLLL